MVRDVGRAAVVVFAVLLAAPLGSADTTSNALGPAQGAIDEAAALISETVVDGALAQPPERTAREARALALAAFIAPMRAPTIHPDATHGELVLSAYPQAAAIADTLLDARAALVTSLWAPACGAGGGAAIELAAARSRMRGALDFLAEIGESPLDLAQVDAARARLDAYLVSDDRRPCEAADAGADPGVSFAPGIGTPGARVTAHLVMPGHSSALLTIPGFGVERLLTLDNGTAVSEFTIPFDAAIALHDVTIVDGNFTLRASLRVARAATALVVEGPEELRAGATGTFEVRLFTTFPSLADGETIHGPSGAVATLRDGTAQFELEFDASRPQRVLGFVFPGNERLQASRARLEVTILLAERADGSGDAESGAVPRLEIAAVILATILAGIALFFRARRAPSHARSKPGPLAPRDPEVPIDAPPRSAIVAFVVWLWRLLRREGVASPSTTAREMRPLASARGLGTDWVEPFEDARYGQTALGPDRRRR